jgi:hypothetical protein
MWMFSSARGFGNVQMHISRCVPCLSFHPVFLFFKNFGEHISLELGETDWFRIQFTLVLL